MIEPNDSILLVTFITIRTSAYSALLVNCEQNWKVSATIYLWLSHNLPAQDGAPYSEERHSSYLETLRETCSRNGQQLGQVYVVLMGSQKDADILMYKVEAVRLPWWQTLKQ